MKERLDGVCGRCLHWHLRGTPCIGTDIKTFANIKRCVGHLIPHGQWIQGVEYNKPCSICKTND